VFDPPELVVGVHSLDPNIPIYAKIRRSTADRGAVLFNIHKASEDVESSKIKFYKEKVAFDDILFDRKFLADNAAETKSLIRAQFKEVKLDISSDVQMHEVTLGEPDIELENGTNEEEQESGRSEVSRNGSQAEPEIGRRDETAEKSVAVAQIVLPLRERLMGDFLEYMEQEAMRESALGDLSKKLEAEKAVTTNYAKTIEDQRLKIAEQESQIKEQKSKMEEQAQTILKIRGNLDKMRRDLGSV
jgi:hypothetical protein